MQAGMGKYFQIIGAYLLVLAGIGIAGLLGMLLVAVGTSSIIIGLLVIALYEFASWMGVRIHFSPLSRSNQHQLR